MRLPGAAVRGLALNAVARNGCHPCYGRGPRTFDLVRRSVMHSTGQGTAHKGGDREGKKTVGIVGGFKRTSGKGGHPWKMR